MVEGRAERDGWSDWLSHVDKSLSGEAASWLARIADSVVDRARLRPGDRVIDLGAGTGLTTLKAARAVSRQGSVTALDSDPACLSSLMSAASVAGYSNVIPLEGHLQNIPSAAASFDAAVCRSALTYAADLVAGVREMLRVLVAGGRFSVFEPLLGEVGDRRIARRVRVGLRRDGANPR